MFNTGALNYSIQWNAAIPYVPGNPVSYGGTIYISLSSNTNSQPPSANWWSWNLVYPANCTGIQLPSTNDLGIIQYAGPSETPYSVPQTTSVDSIIASGSCGILTKTVTKTYSARTVNGTWYRYDNSLGTTFLAPYPLDGTQATCDLIATYMPVTIGGLTRINVLGGCPPPHYATTSIYGLYTIYCANPGDACGGSSSGCTTLFWGNGVLVIAYFLDVHEVWTYSLI